METKTIGKYKVNMKSKANSNNSNYNTLSLTLSENLRTLLKSVCVEGEIEFDSEYSLGNSTITRYLVKGYIMNSIYGRSKNYLFAKKFIDTGKLDLDFTNLEERNSWKDGFREALKTIIRSIDNDELDETLTLTTRREDSE